MANTLGTLRQQVRDRVGYPSAGSGPVTDAELNTYINNAGAELYDLLTLTFEDYYTATTTLTVASGQTANLPADFYKARRVDVLTSASQWTRLDRRPLIEFDDTQRRVLAYAIAGGQLWLDPTAQAVGSYRLWYVPRWVDLATDADAVVDLQHWEEFIVVTVAIKVMVKEESDASGLMQEKQLLLARINTAAKDRDAGLPSRLADVRPMSDTAAPSWWRP